LEVDMRVLLSTALLVVLGLLAVAPSRTTAQGQYVQAGIASGEKLILSFQPNEAGRSCTVIEVRGDFVGCRADAPQIGGGSTAAPGPMGRPGHESWYNLRLVARIDRPTAQQ
jgi:hypothetical protein